MIKCHHSNQLERNAQFFLPVESIVNSNLTSLDNKLIIQYLNTKCNEFFKENARKYQQK